jgi:hypothetical protein
MRLAERMHSGWITGTLLSTLLVLAPIGSTAQDSLILTSESFTLVAPTLSGGGGIDLQSTAADPTVSALGVTIGQSTPVGVSTGGESGIQLRAGFWHVVGAPFGTSDVDTDQDGVLDVDDNCPLHPNGPLAGSDDQADSDMNGIGDVCECSGPDSYGGDASGDGAVNGADYTIWADNFGLQAGTFDQGDFNCDGFVDGADYTIWADNFGLGE